MAPITLAELEGPDPYPALAALRASEPVAWVPAIGAWLVTGHDLVVAAMRDVDTFTVDHPGFTTARVIGPSMLSLDGPEHDRHRAPFVAPFRAGAVRERFEAATRDEAARLVTALRPAGAGELRREFAGPLAAAIVARALGLPPDEVGPLLAWYDAIVGSVNGMSAGSGPTEAGRAAYAALAERLTAASTSPGSLLAEVAGGATLAVDELASSAAVLLFGGIETTEGMIANALAMLLARPAHCAAARGDDAVLEAAIEESLRLEPAAAALDRYATADTVLGGAAIAGGDLVRLSLAAANRDPAVFPDPDAFDLTRPPRRHLAFAQGPHVCLGVHLARLETRLGLRALLDGLPGLRAAPEGDLAIRGLVFRKPPRVDCVWAV